MENEPKVSTSSEGRVFGRTLLMAIAIGGLVGALYGGPAKFWGVAGLFVGGLCGVIIGTFRAKAFTYGVSVLAALAIAPAVALYPEFWWIKNMTNHEKEAMNNAALAFITLNLLCLFFSFFSAIVHGGKHSIDSEAARVPDHRCVAVTWSIVGILTGGAGAMIWLFLYIAGNVS